MPVAVNLRMAYQSGDGIEEDRHVRVGATGSGVIRMAEVRSGGGPLPNRATRCGSECGEIYLLDLS